MSAVITTIQTINQPQMYGLEQQSQHVPNFLIARPSSPGLIVTRPPAAQFLIPSLDSSSPFSSSPSSAMDQSIGNALNSSNLVPINPFASVSSSNPFILPDLPIVQENILEATRQTMAANTVFQRLLDIAETGDRETLQQYLNTSDELNQNMKPESRIFYDKLSDLLDTEIEDLPETQEYEGEIQDNANRLDAWHERVQLVTQFRKEYQNNLQKIERKDPSARFIPNDVEQLIDSKSWEEIQSLDAAYQQLVNKINDTWYELDQQDEPELSDDLAQSLARQVAQLLQTVEERSDLVHLINQAVQIAVPEILLARPESTRLPATQRQQLRMQLRKQNLSQLLQQLRGNQMRNPDVENALIHIWDLTAVDPFSREQNATERRLDMQSQLPTVNARHLLTEARSDIIDKFNQAAQTAHAQSAHEVIEQYHKDAIGTSLEILDQSTTLQCFVCGFNRFVSNKYIDLYQIRQSNGTPGRLFRCGDKTTVLDVLCGNIDDSLAIQTISTGFAAYAVEYENEKLAKYMDREREEKERQMSQFLELGAEEEEKKRKRGRPAGLSRPKKRTELTAEQKDAEQKQFAIEQDEEQRWIENVNILRQQTQQLMSVRNQLLNIGSGRGAIALRTKLTPEQVILRSSLLQIIQPLLATPAPTVSELLNLAPEQIDDLLDRNIQEKELFIAQLENQMVDRANELVNRWSTYYDEAIRGRQMLVLQTRFTDLYKAITNQNTDHYDPFIIVSLIRDLYHNLHKTNNIPGS